jgi:hypothetical protein
MPHQTLFRFSVRCAWLIVAGIASGGAGSTAQAQQFGTLQVDGIRISVTSIVPRPRPGAPAVRRRTVTLAEHRTLLSEASLCGQFRDPNTHRALNSQIRNLIMANAGAKMKSSGFGLHSESQNTLTMTCSTRVDMSTPGSDLRVAVRLPGNSFRARFTTPTVFGGYADPRISITYDLSATTSIAVPKTPQGMLRVGQTTFTVSNIRFKRPNWTGALALQLNNLHTTLTGRDLLADLRKNQQFQLPGLQRSLASLNPAFSKIPAGYMLQPSLDGRVLVLNARVIPKTCPQGTSGTPPNCYPIVR